MVSPDASKSTRRRTVQADGIILTVDESSDNVTERSVLNLVMTPIVADKASTKVVSYLGDQIYLDKIDHKVVAAEVMRVINKFDVKHSRVLAYITDNVAYMTKSFTLFSAFFENCVLVTCTAHLFHLLIDRVPMYATEVHKFITKWQAYFKNSVPRRKRFADFIAGKGLSTAKCPKPCTTRWTPWLRAVLWHEERNRFVSEFLDSEHDQSDSVKSRELQDLVADGTVERYLQYLATVIPTLIAAIEAQETNSVTSHHLVQNIADLKAFIVTEKKSRSHSEWKAMWTEILDKFQQYFEWDGSAPTHCQKGLKFFQRTRLLDPKQAEELNPTISEIQLMPSPYTRYSPTSMSLVQLPLPRHSVTGRRDCRDGQNSLKLLS